MKNFLALSLLLTTFSLTAHAADLPACNDNLKVSTTHLLGIEGSYQPLICKVVGKDGHWDVMTAAEGDTLVNGYFSKHEDQFTALIKIQEALNQDPSTRTISPDEIPLIDKMATEVVRFSSVRFGQ